MSEQYVSIAGVDVPRFLYGTAWKEESTQPLVELAIENGFRGIDTANQRRHYYEAAVGQGIAASIRRGIVARPDLFLQTKFTFRPGQDHRLPYDPQAPVAEQVEQSFASSLQHLGVDMIDSYLLHGPTTRGRLTPADWQAWRAIERIHAQGQTRLIGVSNFTLEQLIELRSEAELAPRFVQNRCYAATGWDRDIRQFCAANAMAYQGFSLLTANRQVLAHPDMLRIAQRHQRSVEQIVFRFALEVGMIPLTGTSSAAHMNADRDVSGFYLDADEIDHIEWIAAR